MEGRVEAIFTAPGEGLATISLARAVARPGTGLDGDRYAAGTGHYSANRAVSRDLTLIEVEVVAALSEELRVAVEPGELRRNVLTRGIRLNDLVGTRFRIGDVLAEGTRLCEPCTYLEGLTGKPVLRPLVHRGGLRANILSPGEIATGDRIGVDVPRIGVAVLVARDGRYLLGKRRSSRGEATWSTPGGELAPGEAIVDCAVRELREETGLEAERPRVVGQTTTILGGAEWRSIIVAVDVAQNDEPLLCEPEKCAGWAWFEPASLPEPLFEPVATVLVS